MIGIANAAILNSPNHNHATRSADTVVPILAHIITPIPLLSAMTPAPVNASTSRETNELLCNSAVDHVPVKILLRGQFVYFCKIPLRLLPHKYLIACSNVCIPNRSRPIPERRSQMLKGVSMSE